MTAQTISACEVCATCVGTRTELMRANDTPRCFMTRRKIVDGPRRYPFLDGTRVICEELLGPRPVSEVCTALCELAARRHAPVIA